MKKQVWTGLGAFIGMLILILDSKSAITAAHQGITLCINTVIPSLFPFLLLSILLTNTLSEFKFGALQIIIKLFQLPKGSDSLLICAFLGGYPIGAQNVYTLYRSGALKRPDAERILAFCNNAGPAFIFGMISSMFPEQWMVWALWGIHILSAFLVASFFPGSEQITRHFQDENRTISNMMYSSIKSMGQICGWVILFRIIISLLSRWILWIFPTVIQIAITGILELTNGCYELQAIKSIPLRFMICSGILAFGGLCVFMQTASVTQGLSLRKYFFGKIMQTVFSILFSGLLILQLWFPLFCIVLFFLVVPRYLQKRSSISGILGV